MDAWDAIKDNEFFSLEGIAFVLKQMFQVAKPPNRFTPEFCIMKKFKDWEIRRRGPSCACTHHCDIGLSACQTLLFTPNIRVVMYG